jgi:poly-beta-1,6-N-acetyl-D-glucosamine synthase
VSAVIFLAWVFIGLTFYVYVGYPVLISLWSFPGRRKISHGDATPSVSLIIAAYNEEAVIGEKIENSLNLDYPPDRFQIIVVADGSEDRTPEIAKTYSEKGVVVLTSKIRLGKSAALNRGVGSATSDILVFSDANANYYPDAIRKLMRNFNDPSVGVVSGRKTVTTNNGGTPEVEGIYWNYESFIKSSESRSGSTVGVVGEINAIRRSLFEAIPDFIINDDFYIALTAMRGGFRVLYEPEAVSWERPSLSLKDDALRRRRMTAGRYQQMVAVDLWWGIGVSNVFRIVSHKFMRLLLPFFMLSALLLNSVAVIFPPHPILLVVTLVLQFIVYAMALIGFATEKPGKKKTLFSAAYYFVNANIASGLGLIRYLRRKESVIWDKARRTS